VNHKEIAKLFVYDDIPLFFPKGCLEVWDKIYSMFAKTDGEINSVDLFKERIIEFFKETTGYDFRPFGLFGVDCDYPTSGSEGVASFSWLNKIGIPILCSRFEENKAPYSGEVEFHDKMFPIVKELIYKEKDGKP
jgi:hypothetical protein